MTRISPHKTKKLANSKKLSIMNSDFERSAIWSMQEVLASSRKTKQANGLVKKFASSIQIMAYCKGQLVIEKRWGQSYRFFDLASLTKIIFTVSTFMNLVEKGQIDLSQRIQFYLPWWPHKSSKVSAVLSHSAGLSWWAPFYKEYLNQKSLNKKSSGSHFLTREEIQRILTDIPLAPGGNKKKRSAIKAVYSDLDFILLGFLIEKVCQKPLPQIWRESAIHNNISGLHFNVYNKPKHKRSMYAPTEKCPWRKKTLRGEVHDDNTWSFGGVSTHAGLFGRIEDVAKFGLILRAAYRGESKKFFKKSTVRNFTKRAVARSRGDWALGFMLPTRGGASCGKYFSAKSFGHTGFTGTSLWYDPVRDLLVVILSNRVHPTRKNLRFVKLRPLLHDSVVTTLTRNGICL